MNADFKKLLDGKRLILASSSPRRIEILRQAKVDFEVIFPEDVKEDNISSDPALHVLELSKRKTENVSKKVSEFDIQNQKRESREKDCLILGADTIVVLNGEILGKPLNREDAFNILKKLSGKEHKVYTGITLLNKNKAKVLSDYQITRVKFNQLQDKEIEEYIDTGEPLDKAGAYGIQGMGSFLVERREGDLDNVIGLPMRKLKELLTKISS